MNKKSRKTSKKTTKLSTKKCKDIKKDDSVIKVCSPTPSSSDINEKTSKCEEKCTKNCKDINKDDSVINLCLPTPSSSDINENTFKCGKKRTKKCKEIKKDESVINLYSPTSSSSDINEKTCKCGKKSRFMIDDIIQKIFDEGTGVLQPVSSLSLACCSVYNDTEEDKPDSRLMVWQKTIQHRKRIEERIKKRTGKNRTDMLLNHAANVSERDKQMVKNILDLAERLNPIRLQNPKQLRLREYEKDGRHINELISTLPKTEKIGRNAIEIAGIPSMVRREMLSNTKIIDSNDKWLQSNVLAQRLISKRKDIKRVLKFYPDIDKLQVLGKRYDIINNE